MSNEFEQVPFAGAEFAENPEPRCACVLLLDTSGSMGGAPIAELNAGLIEFQSELQVDGLASKRVEICILTFGPVHVATEFTSAKTFVAPHLVAAGVTPMGEA
jgi:uncharacterized protein YegL